MKKVLFILLFVFSIILTGCSNKVVPNEEEVTLYLDENFTKYMKYEEVPSFTLSFSGTLNTIANVNKTFYTIFASNDDFKLSEIISNLFNKYKDNIYFEVVEVKEESSTRINSKNDNGEIEPLTYSVDDNKVYYEVAYINLENGLKVTFDYRRFMNNDKNYYVWRYESNIGMTINYPLMIIKDNNEKEMVLITLPNRIKYKVGPQLVPEKIIKDDSYLEDINYTFEYLSDIEKTKEKQQYVIDYYIENHDGVFISDKLYFTYLGIKFAVVLNDNNFIIKYVEKIS